MTFTSTLICNRKQYGMLWKILSHGLFGRSSQFCLVIIGTPQIKYMKLNSWRIVYGFYRGFKALSSYFSGGSTYFPLWLSYYWVIAYRNVNAKWRCLSFWFWISIIAFLCFFSQRSGAKTCWNVGGEACASEEIDQQRSSGKIGPLCKIVYTPFARKNKKKQDNCK